MQVVQYLWLTCSNSCANTDEHFDFSYILATIRQLALMCVSGVKPFFCSSLELARLACANLQRFHGLFCSLYSYFIYYTFL